MLNVLVPEVVLQSPCVVAVIGELEPTGVTKPVRVDGEWHLGSLTDAMDEPVETYGAFIEQSKRTMSANWNEGSIVTPDDLVDQAPR